jgi:methylated-DNA-protein-cysteine methyltransferase-like protein
MEQRKLYDLIYDAVRQIPSGKIASYGQISNIVGRCSAQMVGFALAALTTTHGNEDVPWQRVVNSQGTISTHGAGVGGGMQRALLEEEGVEFGLDGVIDFEKYGWLGAPKTFKKIKKK